LIVALIGITLIILYILLNQVGESLISLMTNVGHWTYGKYLRWLVFSVVIHSGGAVTFGLVRHLWHLINFWLLQVQILACIAANHLLFRPRRGNFLAFEGVLLR